MTTLKNRFTKTKLLFGEEKFAKFTQTNVIIFGVGGVGGAVLDCLYRTGIQNITIVDFDIFDITNQNRQIGSDNNIGKKKIEVLKNIYPNIKIIDKKITVEWVENFDFLKFDFIIDALDEVRIKVALAKKVYSKLISSMGSANIGEFSQIETVSIWKTYNDPLAKAVRTQLRKANFQNDFRVVFSPNARIGEIGGSFIGVTASFGLKICSEVVAKI